MARAYLADLGLAKRLATASRYTRAGETLGTPDYMPPEQARGELGALGPPSDVWALGCVLYELIAGRRPFPGATAEAVIGAVILARPPRLPRGVLGCPAGVQRLVDACLAKRAASRPVDADAVREACQRLLDGRSPLGRPGSRVATWGVVAVAIGGVVMMLAAGGRTSQQPVPLPAPAPPADRVEALVAYARSQQVGDPARAAAALGEAIALAPERHDLRVEQGLLHWALGRDADAQAAWAAVPPDASAAAEAWLYRGLEALFRLDAREAHDHLARAAERGGPDAPLARAGLAVAAGRWAEARAHLPAAKGWEADLLRAAVEHWGPAGDPAAAIRAYDAALSGGRRFAWALGNRGAMRGRVGDDAGALEDYDAALALDPANVASRVNRGRLRASRGDADGARSDFDAALAAEPRHVQALNHRGNLREALGDAAGARADFDAALGLDPRYVLALLNRAGLRLRQGDLAGAREDYDALLAVAPTDVSGRFCRAAVRQRQGDLPGALEDVDAALAVDPRHVSSRDLRVELRAASGDAEGALADADAVLAQEPGRVWTRVRRARLRLDARDAARAIEDLETAAAALAPDAPLRADVEALLARARTRSSDDR